MKRGSQKRNNGLNFALPEDIVLQILLLLPFESVLACKHVCRQWYTLINHPNFSKHYHHKGSMILSLVENKVYCVLIRRFPSYTVHRLPIFLTKGGRLPHELLSGWSNGIACVKVANGYFHLYNLFTGASYTVEDAPLQPLHEFWTHYGFGYDPFSDGTLVALSPKSWIYYGFGYDCYDDDHKIMVVCDYGAAKGATKFMRKRFSYECEKANFDESAIDIDIDIDKAHNKENSRFWVYSCRSRTWKSFDGFPYAAYSWGSFSEGGSYSSNGVLHYPVIKDKLVDGNYRPRVTGKHAIVTYDLHSNRFGEILARGDDYDILNNFRVAKVTELDGQLCLCCVYLMANKWFVQINGVDGSWTKVQNMDRSIAGLTYTAQYESGDGRKVVLFVCSGKLVWSNFNSNEIIEVVDVPTRWKPTSIRTAGAEMDDRVYISPLM